MILVRVRLSVHAKEVVVGEIREGFEKRTVYTNPKPTSRRPMSDFDLFQKLKDFYAQPLDGCWPLRPCWVPDLDKPPKHVFHRISSNTKVNRFRRFTFEEFVQILENKRHANEIPKYGDA